MALDKISSALAFAKHFEAALAIVVRKHGTTGISGIKMCFVTNEKPFQMNYVRVQVPFDLHLQNFV